MDQQDYTYKTIVVGDQGVGKTSLIFRLTDGKFKDNYDITIGVDYAQKKLDVKNEHNEKRTVKVQIWDTAGQEAFKSITRSYYRDTVGGLLVFDVARRSSFESIKIWLKDIQRLSDISSSDHLILVGNKADKEAYRDVEFKTAKKFADDHGLCYIETSAKTGHMVTHVFEKLAQDIYTKYPDGLDADKDRVKGIVKRARPMIDLRNEEKSSGFTKKCC